MLHSTQVAPGEGEGNSLQGRVDAKASVLFLVCVAGRAAAPAFLRLPFVVHGVENCQGEGWSSLEQGEKTQVSVLPAGRTWVVPVLCCPCKCPAFSGGNLEVKLSRCEIDSRGRALVPCRVLLLGAAHQGSDPESISAVPCQPAAGFYLLSVNTRSPILERGRS